MTKERKYGLRVDSRSPITGSIPGPQGEIEIQEGEYEGSVKEIQILPLEVEIAPGLKLRSVEEKIKALKETGKS